MNELQNLEERLAIRFGDRSLYLRALTHRSFLNENPRQAIEDNERLEFLGDAVLDFVVGAYLYHHLPEMREGELTMLRSALVRTGTLAGFARQLGLGELLRLGHGEAEGGGRERSANLCAAFEAIVGALYLDHGLEAVEELIQRVIAPALEEIIAAAAHRDAKSEFQIWSQAELGVTPRYELLAADGPDHRKVFTIAVLVNDEQWGVGQGSNKQAAEQAAATIALDKAEAAGDEASPRGAH